MKSTGWWGAEIFDQSLFWVFLWRCFWMRLTVEWVDCIKQMALRKDSEPHLSLEDLNRTKRLTLPKSAGVIRNSSCLTTFKCEHRSFSDLGLKQHWLLLRLELAIFQAGITSLALLGLWFANLPRRSQDLAFIMIWVHSL